MNCAKKTLQQAGFRQFLHLALQETGLHKGRLAGTDAELAAGLQAAREKLQKPG